MRIYIKDIPLRIKKTEEVSRFKKYDYVLEEEDFLINERKLKKNLLILSASSSTIKSILFILHNKKLKNLDSVTIVPQDYETSVAYIKSKFKIIKAGGGVVFRDGKILFIHRMGMWDLPKGKIEKGEAFKEGALREVEEECNVRVEIVDKVCTTWHTYTKGEKSILKKTVWYHMNCLDDSDKKPQIDEGIDEVRWMNENETNVALYNSYKSITHVLTKFKKKVALKA